MPFVAVTSVKLGVTVRPPGTTLSSVTVNASEPPSLASASATVRIGVSSSLIVPVPATTAIASPSPVYHHHGSDCERVSPTVRVSASSGIESSFVQIEKCFFSPAVPANVICSVFAV